MILSCKLTYDLQPIVKNKPQHTIIKGDRSKHCRSVVADQIASNRAINESYDLVCGALWPCKKVNCDFACDTYHLHGISYWCSWTKSVFSAGYIELVKMVV